MKVLHVVPAYEPAWQAGGVVRAVSQLCRGLSGGGIDVTVYTTDTSGNGWLDVPTGEPVMVGGVKVFYFHTPLPGTVRYSGALGQMCEKTMGQFDIVHIASFWNYPGIPVGVQARRQEVPYLISTHGTLVPHALRQGGFKKWLYMKLVENRNLRYAEALHYTTELERRNMAHLEAEAPSFVIPNPLNCKEFDRMPDAHLARRRLDIGEEDIVLSYLGRLHRGKGLDLLVKAFGAIASRFPRTQLLLAGPDDGYRSTLQAMVDSLGLKNRVRFLGFVDRKARSCLFSSTDVSVTLSESENFCYAVVEAMAAGVPVLLSEQVGVSSAVEDDGAGCVVPARLDIVIAKLSELLADPQRLERMGRIAHQSARKRYDVNIVASRMMMAYKDILTGQRRSSCQWTEGN